MDAVFSEEGRQCRNGIRRELPTLAIAMRDAVWAATHHGWGGGLALQEARLHIYTLVMIVERRGGGTQECKAQTKQERGGRRS